VTHEGGCLKAYHLRSDVVIPAVALLRYSNSCHQPQPPRRSRRRGCQRDRRARFGRLEAIAVGSQAADAFSPWAHSPEPGSRVRSNWLTSQAGVPEKVRTECARRGSVAPFAGPGVTTDVETQRLSPFDVGQRSALTRSIPVSAIKSFLIKSLVYRCTWAVFEFQFLLNSSRPTRR